MGERLTWENVRVRLGDLQPWAGNPRRSNKRQAERLVVSEAEFGQPETVAIGPENEVYNGHQRLSAWLAAHGPDFEVDARRSSRALTEEERRKLTIYLHGGATGDWDWGTLEAWDPGELTAWGLDGEAARAMAEGATALEALLAQGEEEEEPDPLDGLIPDGDRYSEQYGVIVLCESEAHQESVYNKLLGEGYNVKVVVT